MNNLLDKLYTILIKRYFNGKKEPTADPSLVDKFISISRLLRTASLLAFLFFVLFSIYWKGNLTGLFYKILAVILVIALLRTEISRLGHALHLTGFISE